MTANSDPGDTEAVTSSSTVFTVLLRRLPTGTVYVRWLNDSSTDTTLFVTEDHILLVALCRKAAACLPVELSLRTHSDLIKP